MFISSQTLLFIFLLALAGVAAINLLSHLQMRKEVKETVNRFSNKVDDLAKQFHTIALSLESIRVKILTSHEGHEKRLDELEKAVKNNGIEIQQIHEDLARRKT